jgi:hypothetical protein
VSARPAAVIRGSHSSRQCLLPARLTAARESHKCPRPAPPPKARQRVLVSFGSFYPDGERPGAISPQAWDAAADRLYVAVDGRIAMDLPSGFVPAIEATTYVCSNPLGASTCEPDFRGLLHPYERTFSELPFFPEINAAP